MISIAAHNAHLQRKPSDPLKCCPTCARPYPAESSVVVDVAGNTVLRGGELVRLTRQEMDIFNAVWRHRPFVVSHDRIVIQAFDPGADVEDNHIRVVLFSINKKIEKLGILIRNVPGEGYRGVLTAV